MGNIFISYRREDSAGHTGRLFDRMREHFGRDRVFMDIAAIEPGVDFVETIEKAVGSCGAFIVVIGKQWLSVTDAEGRHRLDNPEDFIHLELASALRRNIRVIPVMVQGAGAPGSENLPEDLKRLSRLQAHEISDNRWDYDVGKLIETIEKVLKKEITKASGGKDEAVPKPFKFSRWAIAVIAASIIGIGVYAIWPTVPTGIEMPNVVGGQFDKAKAVLADKGLSVSTSEKPTSEKPTGIVVDQKPEPGVKLKKGDRVDLVLAVKPLIKIPNVVGKTIEEAKAALREAGLAIFEVREIKTNDWSPEMVIDQDPKPSMEMKSEESVALIIALKPDSPVMPSGLTLTQGPPLEQQKQAARKLAENCFAAILRKDVGALLGIASLPFFFDTEVLTRFEDLEKKWKTNFSQMASYGKDLSTSKLKEIKAQTISEWRKEGYDLQRDRFLKQMEYNDGDFKISVLIEMGTHKHGLALYTRNVGSQIKLAGFWD